jgi:enamine deaminase RidA (YjgF/YER057c/UK114 family)
MNQVKFINPEGVMKNPAFSQAVIIGGKGKTIYIGGQNAVDANGETIGKGDISAQTEQIMKNIGIILESVGAGFKNIVKFNIYITPGQDAMKAFEASQKYMPKSTTPPIVTALFVAGMGNPDYLLEIEATAFISEID